MPSKMGGSSVSLTPAENNSGIWNKKPTRSALLYLSIFVFIAIYRGPSQLLHSPWTAWLYALLGIICLIFQFANQDWLVYGSAVTITIVIALMTDQAFWALFTFSIGACTSLFALLLSVVLDFDDRQRTPRYAVATIGVGLAIAGLVYGAFSPAPSWWVQGIHDLKPSTNPRTPPIIVGCSTICVAGLFLFLAECSVCLPLLLKILDRFGWLLAPLTLLVAAFKK